MKYIYSFSEGNKDMKDLLGGKGANLAEMTKLGLPVPPGFTITTEMCNYYLANQSYPDGFFEELKEKLAELESKMRKNFGDPENPLFVSVRSGAKFSMPGMMDTVLNLGLNDQTVKGLIKLTANERFAYDACRRFVHMFGDVVLKVEHDLFEEAISKLKNKKGVKLDTELTALDLKKLTEKYQEIVRQKTGRDFPEKPEEQLKLAIEAVFHSWNGKRARTYRKLHGIPDNLGTAVNIQAMVFGNLGKDSGTGVAFTRNPTTGKNEFYGEFLMNAQGEDVVAGIRTPHQIQDLKKILPKIYQELLLVRERLDRHYRDMQDLEFTIEKGKLYVLQTRAGKRTALAAVRIAVEMVQEKLISKKEALLRVNPNQLQHLLHPCLDPKVKKRSLAKGLAASPGAVFGKVVFTADDAYEWKKEKDEKVILVRKETSPEDIHGMDAAQGILTSMGGLTSHAALVCRGMGKCCVAGCGEISVNVKQKYFKVKDKIVREGEIITLDGGTGEVFLGELPTVEPRLTSTFSTLMKWADEVRKLGVRTNADMPKDVKVALDFGAEGIGLCRTEHMFFEEDRIPKMREMILAKDREGREKALKKLLPLQKKDFKEIFEIMKGLPVLIRLLDPPLHEFLPQEDKKIEELAKEMKIEVLELKQAVANLHEINPMLAHRGCRLGITYPEIYEMQVRAIFEAAKEVKAKGISVKPEIEVPLVGEVNELKVVREMIEKVARELKVDFEYKVGTMIELPRACLTADKIAKEADFFSFGTNDLTQTTYGISRDDGGKFLPYYIEKGIFPGDPTESIDREGVGELMKLGIKLGRQVKIDLEIGICGEHGGEPRSVEFCHQIGLNYVSCSPYRVPVARLAAAQAALKEQRT